MADYKLLGQTLSGQTGGTWNTVYTVPSGKCFVGSVHGTHLGTADTLYVRNRVGGGSALFEQYFWRTGSIANQSYLMDRVCGAAGDVFECATGTASRAAVSIMGVELPAEEGFQVLALIASSSSTATRTLYTVPSGYYIHAMAVITNDSGTNRNIEVSIQPATATWAEQHLVYRSNSAVSGSYVVPNIVAREGNIVGVMTGGANCRAMLMGRLLPL